MAYLTKEYYVNSFRGAHIPDGEFERLAQTASDVIDALVTRPITEETDKDALAKATAYQLEYIYQQGGLDAVTGAAANQQVVTEKLDDYSVSQQLTTAAEQNQISIYGLPVSPLALMILRKLGLMSRWLYSGRGCCHGQ